MKQRNVRLNNRVMWKTELYRMQHLISLLSDNSQSIITI